MLYDRFCVQLCLQPLLIPHRELILCYTLHDRMFLRPHRVAHGKKMWLTHSEVDVTHSLTHTKIIMKWKLACVQYVIADALCVKIVGFKAKICHFSLVRNCWNKNSILYSTSCMYVCLWSVFLYYCPISVKISVRRQMAVGILSVSFGDSALFQEY